MEVLEENTILIPISNYQKEERCLSRKKKKREERMIEKIRTIAKKHGRIEATLTMILPWFDQSGKFHHHINIRRLLPCGTYSVVFRESLQRGFERQKSKLDALMSK